VADSLKKLNNSLVSLALAQREHWEYLLKSFEKDAYQPKVDFLLPSFSTLVSEHCKEKGLALDVGCGSGLLGRKLINRGWKVKGLDILPEAVKMTVQYFPACVGAVENLPYPSQTFDLVVCSMVLMLIKDANTAMYEMARILKSDGVLFLAILNPAYEGDERIKVAKCNSNGVLEQWRFNIEHKHVDVDYYWRSLDYYLNTIMVHFKICRAYEICSGGSLNQIVSSNSVNAEVEYIWYLAFK